MNRLRAIPGWLFSHPRIAAPGLGALAATGFAPLHFWPLTLLAVAGLIELLARAGSRRQALLLGWLFGAAHFTIGNNWIATAFTYQANMPAWLGWVAVVLLSFYLAIYPALATCGAWLLARSNLRHVGIALAGTWIVTEWLRSWVFTGFAWNPLGVVLLGDFASRGLALLAPWTGTYGLSGFVVLLATGLRNAPIVLSQVEPGRRRRAASGFIAASLVTVLLMVVPYDAAEQDGTRRFTLVQPDIRQEVLNDPATYEEQFARLARLSAHRPDQAERLVLWPESGVPDYLEDGYPPRYYAYTYAADPGLARRRLGMVAGPGSILLSGTADLELENDRAVGARNSVTAIDGAGAIRGSYDKAHLVPGGEYLPLRSIAEPLGLSRLVPGAIDFWPGPGPATLDLGPHGRVGVQVCYEIIFSGQVTDRAHRPDFIFNPSNDGWFGAWGPPQHLAQARLRAIEEGLPVLRSTTTGISAVIDANGVVRSHVPRHVAGRIDGLIPPAKPPTLFARLGNILPLGWAVILLVLGIVASRRRHG